MMISMKDNGTRRWLRGLCPLTNEASLHSSVVVVGERVEDAAAPHFIRLVHDSFDYPHHLIVAQLIACIAWRERERERRDKWSSVTDLTSGWEKNELRELGCSDGCCNCESLKPQSEVSQGLKLGAHQIMYKGSPRGTSFTQLHWMVCSVALAKPCADNSGSKCGPVGLSIFTT